MLGAGTATPSLTLDPERFLQHVEAFNAMEPETAINHIPDRESWAWLKQNIPFFECPDSEVERIYYFRWWSFRKHIVRTPSGFVFTEFLTPVGHAGPYNTISCAAGFHIMEGRWLHDSRYVDDYITFWLRGNHGRPQPHFHKYSSWFAAAVYDRTLVTGNSAFGVRLIKDLRKDYLAWEKEHQASLLPGRAVGPSGSDPKPPSTKPPSSQILTASESRLFWQYDVRDGMEESISGSREEKHVRPTINSYMFANARAIAALARAAHQPSIAREFEAKAEALKKAVQEALWDPSAEFFKVRLESGGFSSAREAIGFIPWMFSLPDCDKGYEVAWRQLQDPTGFRAPFGITTAERRHPEFRSHGIGTCEWDGAVWPFATSQTLCALATVLQEYKQDHVTRRDYFDAFLTYVHSQQSRGKPFIGEYLDEVTGDWINGRNDRSRYYNHSLFADLLITGLIGLRPTLRERVEVRPLLPAGAWDWFCLDQVKYHGHMLTIIWDRHGNRYGRGPGLILLADGVELARTAELSSLSGLLPPAKP